MNKYFHNLQKIYYIMYITSDKYSFISSSIIVHSEQFEVDVFNESA